MDELPETAMKCVPLKYCKIYFRYSGLGRHESNIILPFACKMHCYCSNIPE